MGELALRRRQSAGMVTAILTLLLLLAVAMLAAASFGAAPMSWRAALSVDGIDRSILVHFRLPRVLAAALIGAILAAAGATFQSLLRNPLADPFILGVSGGAACGAAIGTAAGLARIPGLVPLIAFAGACGATFAVFLLARRRGHTDSTRLLLSGLVLNAFFSALILMAFALTAQSDLAAGLRWMMGSLTSVTWRDVALLAVFFMSTLAVLVYVANDLRLLAFGEDDARSRGVDVERLKLIGFGAASLATGATVAVAGIIGFVGLLVPHLVRLAWRRDFRFLLPLCAAGGALLMVLADLASRALFAPIELPIGAFTALLGVPFFLSLLRGER